MTTETTPNTSAGQPAPLPASHSALPPAGNGKRRRALLILLVITLLAGISWTAYYLLVARWQQDTDDAYVQGNVVSITPQTMGTVVAINADDGMRVSAGVGSLALTGLAASLRHLRVLPAGPGVYVLTGSDASLIYTPTEEYKLLRISFSTMKKPGMTGSLRSPQISISHRSASIGADGLQ